MAACTLAAGGPACGHSGTTGAVAAPVADYRITYDVRIVGAEPPSTARVLAVRRPFDASDISAAATPDGTTGLVAVGSHLYSVQGAQALDFGDRVPFDPPGDVRLSVVLDELRAHGFASDRGHGVVLGVRCRLVRLGGPLGDRLTKPTAKEHADVCFDARGLPLSERWVSSGKLLRTTTATAVETSPLGDDAFSLGGREITESPIGRGIVRALPLDQIPATGYRYWTVDHPPFGFTAARRDLAVTTGEPATGQILRDVAYIDTFVRGSDVIAVEQRDAGYASQTGTTIGTIGAGALGPGRVTVTAQGPALQFAEGASVVTVRGSVDVAHLRAFARLLRPNKVREQ